MILSVFLCVSPAGAEDESKNIEQYKANAMIRTGGGGGSMVEISISRWSSDDERDEVRQAIREAGDLRERRHVAQVLRGQKRTGHAFRAGRRGYPLRYARSFDMGDGERQILLATDRPVSFGEVYNQQQYGDFDCAVIVLKVDKDGNGEGLLSIGTEITWNEESSQPEVTNVTSQPIMLSNVRRVD